MSVPAEVSAATTPSTRGRISRLPPLLVNQIAAGEVVERPASVVKEVVENALDARARRVRVELEQGGIELIRITDDGHGIHAEDLPLAVAPHATSKIAAPEDLDRIGTFGFRGEALASIASVSRLSVRSRCEGEGEGSQIDVEGDRVSPVRPAAGPAGTQVTVRNLFFNTPARRKFLRTSGTEQGHAVDAATALAMAHPAVAFRVECDGRVSVDVPPGQSPRERAVALLGQELESQLLEAAADRFDDSRGMALWGLIGLPSLARATAKAQFVFLNGRLIRDKTVQHAVREAYRGLIEPGRHPTVVLMLGMDPGAVDVNVHPAKTEVRFRDQSMVHSVVLRAVREALQRADLTPAVGNSGGAGWWARRPEERAAILPDGGGVNGAGFVEPRTIVSPEEGRRQVAAFVDFFRRPVSAAPQERLSFTAPASDTPSTSAPADDPPAVPAPSAVAQPVAESPLLAAPRPADRVLQVHNSYVVTQDEQGLLIVDQHALHERVMFEYLLSRFVGGEGKDGARLESQSLLTPVVVRATPRQIERLGEMRPLLERIGISAEPLGPESVGVQAFPTFLFDRRVDPGEFLADLLERAEAEGFSPGGEEALHEVLDMMACKAAVKAGDHMAEEQLKDLLRLREVVERSSNCPHGRPTAIRLTIRELEKRFGRT